jgi:hypothetical protein
MPFTNLDVYDRSIEEKAIALIVIQPNCLWLLKNNRQYNREVQTH